MRCINPAMFARRQLLLLAVMLLAGAAVSPAAGARGENLLDRPDAVSVISAEELENLPSSRNIEDILSLQPGQPVVVNGRYPTVTLRGLPGRERPATTLPTRLGTTVEGVDVTAFEMPKQVPLGRATLEFVQANGNPYQRPIVLYAYLDAYLDREKLSSGQRAQFRYDLDFGEGPGRISMLITTSGPIVYQKNNQWQMLPIGADGKARLVDYITALRGSPTGIPFSITPDFANLALQN